MSPRKKSTVDEATVFVRYHLGRDCFAPFTGQDLPAWRAFVYLVECYSHGGGQDALLAMTATVRCAQARWNILRCFVQAIPAVLDWSAVAQIWPQVAQGIALHDMGSQFDARLMSAREENDHHPARLHGWQPCPTQEGVADR